MKYGWEKLKIEKPISALKAKRDAFPLGPDMYGICSLKFTRKKQNCKREDTLFEVNMEDLEWPTHCPVLGIELDWLGLNGDWRTDASPSFDKIDPKKGYTKGNVMIISWRANRIKNDGNAEEHRKIAAYIDNKLT